MKLFYMIIVKFRSEALLESRIRIGWISIETVIKSLQQHEIKAIKHNFRPLRVDSRIRM